MTQIEVKVNDKLTLRGKTVHAKNRIRQWGNKWKVLKVTNDKGLMISAVNDTELKKGSSLPESVRWLEPFDFEIVEIEHV